MRFSTRQFAVFVTCVGAWLGLAARGHYLLGWWGLPAFGLPFGLALLLLSYMLVQWHETSFAQRVMLSGGIHVGISAGVFLSSVAFHNGLHTRRDQMREVSRLECLIHQDQRFRSVVVSCEGVAAGQYLRVRGVVPSQGDLDDLHLRVDEAKVKWPVYCQVEVVRR
jgi:hypothetical protein